MKNSSAIALRDALNKLLVAGKEHLSGAQIYKAGRAARWVADDFKNVNSDLNSAWQNTADFVSKINRQLQVELMSLYDSVVDFCDKTYFNESEATLAANNANALAESLLKELNISTD